MTAAARLGENTRLLYFAIKLFERTLERTIRVHNNLAHQHYQRDLLEC